MSEGRKDDHGKLRYDLIPVRPLADLAEVYTVGASKYTDRNWETGIKWSRILAAMFRHLEAFRAGELRDKESGCYHLASVAWGAFALLEYTRTHLDLDDRVMLMSDDELNAELNEAAREYKKIMLQQIVESLQEGLNG